MTQISFPSRPDVRLRNPPLAEVICQVRFDPILMIAQEDPARFQQLVRHRFPKYEKQQLLTPVRSLNVPQQFELQLGAQSHRFRESDSGAEITLATDFVALTTEHYTEWADFEASLALISQAMSETYSPVAVTRTGLRYVNKFRPESLELEGIDDLLGLFNASYVGPFKLAEVQRPRVFATHLELDGGPSETLAIRLVVDPREVGGPVVLDLDYYHEGYLGLESLPVEASRFHAAIWSAFCYILTDEAIDMFGPVAKAPAKEPT